MSCSNYSFAYSPKFLLHITRPKEPRKVGQFRRPCTRRPGEQPCGLRVLRCKRPRKQGSPRPPWFPQHGVRRPAGPSTESESRESRPATSKPPATLTSASTRLHQTAPPTAPAPSGPVGCFFRPAFPLPSRAEVTSKRCDWAAWWRGSGCLCCQKAEASHRGLWRPTPFSLRLWQSLCADVTRPPSATELSCRPPPGWARQSAVRGGRSREGRAARPGAAAGRNQAGVSTWALGLTPSSGLGVELWRRTSRDAGRQWDGQPCR